MRKVVRERSNKHPKDAIITIALGGNALSPEGKEGNIDEQFEQTRRTAVHIIDLVKKRFRIILTHGNGPQVGSIIRRVEIASKEVYKIPLDLCVADTQGGMGYMITQCLQNELRKRHIDRTFMTVVTTVEVDRRDPAFKEPSKPIGRYYTTEQAQEFMARHDWKMKEYTGKGFRRVVPSPIPKKILEIELIRRLAFAGELIVACGGGGIPVVTGDDRVYHGIEAVIDKDLTTALLAASVDAATLMIVTGVNQVALNYGTPDEKKLDRLTIDEAVKYYKEGQFPSGSMGPKIEAAVNFLNNSMRVDARVLICDIEGMADALNGIGGTWIVRE